MSACALLHSPGKEKAYKDTGKDLVKILGSSLKNCDKAGAAAGLFYIVIEYVADGRVTYDDVAKAIMIYTLSKMVSDISKYPEEIEREYRLSEEKGSHQNETRGKYSVVWIGKN